MTVWRDLSRCRFTSFLFKPGNDARNPASMVSHNVDRVGNPSNAWWSWVRSDFVVSARMMAFAVWCPVIVGVLLSSCTVHIPWVYPFLSPGYAMADEDDGTMTVADDEALFGEVCSASVVAQLAYGK